jgi:predicted RNA-binding Zn-ribbon protein involved in translation (DUF1610 family)
MTEADIAAIFFIKAMAGLGVFILVIKLLNFLYSSIPSYVCSKCGRYSTVKFVKTTSCVNKIRRKETTYHFKCNACSDETSQTYQTKYKA